MRNRKAAMGAAALWILIPATPVPAHHSRVVFDEEKTITIEGVMTNVAWANPHSLFFVSARPAEPAGRSGHPLERRGAARARAGADGLGAG